MKTITEPELSTLCGAVETIGKNLHDDLIRASDSDIRNAIKKVAIKWAVAAEKLSDLITLEIDRHLPPNKLVSLKEDDEPLIED